MRRSADERRRSRRLGAPYLAPALLAAAAAALLWTGRDRLAAIGANTLESPETQVRRAVANLTRGHLDDVYGYRAGGTAELAPARYRDLTVAFEGPKAVVTAQLEAEGHVDWRGESAALTYLGRERFHLHPCSIALWCAEGDGFDRLRGVLLTLFRREDAYNARDASALERLVSERYRAGEVRRAELLRRVAGDFAAEPGARVRVLSWQIRADRDEAQVGEDYELAEPGRGVKRLRAFYRLVRDEGRWQLVSGL
ncbi:MAG TPA: nuclear transport factor 2 family protein [Anaeromyxobacteraceae bacterium]|nr:nuclear transport factor 2 family protein [Anaeromyxobacteraceae bacterium]